MACIGLIKMNFGAIALFVQFIKVINAAIRTLVPPNKQTLITETISSRST